MSHHLNGAAMCWNSSAHISSSAIANLNNQLSRWLGKTSQILDLCSENARQPPPLPRFAGSLDIIIAVFSGAVATAASPGPVEPNHLEME